MKYTLVFLSSGVILLLVATLFEINYLDYRRPVPYSQWDKISLADFRGLKMPFQTLEGASKYAFIKTNRTVNYEGEHAIEIISFFHPSRSYVFAHDIRSPGLLRHELYHFHICEYISRLFRKEIATYNGMLTHQMIRELSGKYHLLEEELQRQYDQDSDHSYILREQKNWEIKVDEWLISLRGFSLPVVYFKNKE